MHTFLIVIHVMVCLILILVVLLQRGKGSDMGAALGGGGSNTVFGSRGAGNFLTKLTTAAAIVFMLTSLSLSYLTTRASNILDLNEADVEALAPEQGTDTGTGTPPEAAGEAPAAKPEASADELVEMDIEPSGKPADDGAPADQPTDAKPAAN